MTQIHPTQGDCPMSTETTAKTEALPPAAAWDALALECSQLAALAERIRDRISTVEDPAVVLDELRAAHEQVDAAARAVLPLAGECRRATYTALRKTMDVAQIREAFGLGTVQAVYNVLEGRRSAAKKKRSAGQLGSVQSPARPN